MRLPTCSFGFLLLLCPALPAQVPQQLSSAFYYLAQQRSALADGLAVAQAKYARTRRMAGLAEEQHDSAAAAVLSDATRVAARLVELQQQRLAQLDKLIEAFHAASRRLAERRRDGPVVVMPGGDSLASLRNGQLLKPSDNHNIQLVTADGGFASVGRGSVVRVIDALRDEYELLRGAFYYARVCLESPPHTCPPERTSIRGPTVVVAVRGTDMDMRVAGDSTLLEVRSGAVEVRDTLGSILRRVEAGSRVTVRRDHDRLRISADTIPHEKWWQNP